MKTVRWIPVLCAIALVSAVGGCCAGPQQPVVKPDPPVRPFCVLDSIPENSEWLDAEEEMRIRFSGKSAEYWVDGRQKDPACHWVLQHVRHGRGKCVFQCDSPSAEWSVSVGKATDGQSTVHLEKNVDGRLLAKSYEFVSAANTGK